MTKSKEGVFRISLNDLPNEIWNDVPEYEGVYKSSNLGRVKSLNRIVFTKNGVSKRIKEKILKLGLCEGYKVITLSKNNETIKTGVHRVIALTFIPNPENKPCVNHINGIKDDNRVENLEWCTYAENERHSWDVLHKKRPVGVLSNSCKLTEQKVLAIRRLHKINPKYNRKIISEKLGLHPVSLNDIHRRKSWKHI